MNQPFVGMRAKGGIVAMPGYISNGREKNPVRRIVAPTLLPPSLAHKRTRAT